MTTKVSTTGSKRRRIITATGRGAVFVALLGAAVFFVGGRALHAQDPDQQKQVVKTPGFPCSVATLNGRYALSGQGQVPSGLPPAPMVPFAVVSLDTLDGQGNLTDAATVSVNGAVASNTNPGTYTVNDDCTGTFTVVIPGNVQLNHNLVIADKGNEFYLIGTAGVLTLVGKRID